jgi:hypothetical protein
MISPYSQILILAQEKPAREKHSAYSPPLPVSGKTRSFIKLPLEPQFLFYISKFLFFLSNNVLKHFLIVTDVFREVTAYNHSMSKPRWNAYLSASTRPHKD